MGIRYSYSSVVRLGLIIEDRQVELASIGPTSVVLRMAASLPSGGAEIVMTVDGNERRWSVFLPHPTVPFDTIVPIAETV